MKEKHTPEIQRKMSSNAHLARSKSLDWYPMDVKERYLSQPKEHRDRWDNVKISYDINSYGFRSKEVTCEERESITILGCSHTFGIGMPEEHIWPSVLSKKMNLPYHNLASAGGSLDGCFRVYNEWAPIIKSKITCLLIPPGIRFECYETNIHKFKNMGPWVIEREDYPHEANILLADSFFKEELNHVNKERNLAAIQYIADCNDSKLFLVDASYLTPFYNTRARDGSHASYEGHAAVAEEFYRKITEEA